MASVRLRFGHRPRQPVSTTRTLRPRRSALRARFNPPRTALAPSPCRLAHLPHTITISAKGAAAALAAPLAGPRFVTGALLTASWSPVLESGSGVNPGREGRNAA